MHAKHKNKSHACALCGEGARAARKRRGWPWDWLALAPQNLRSTGRSESGRAKGMHDVLHVDQEQDPTRMLERALNGARSCNHSSKPRAVVHRVIRDDVRVCQRDSSRSIDRTQLQCCRRERCVSVVEVIGKL